MFILKKTIAYITDLWYNYINNAVRIQREGQ